MQTRTEHRGVEDPGAFGFEGYLGVELVGWQLQSASVLRAAGEGLVAVLLAPACAACGRPLDRPLESAVCPRCWQGIRPLTPPVCRSCAEPLTAWRLEAGSRCARCRSTAPIIALAAAIGEYEGSLRDIVHAFKYGGRRSLAGRLASLMSRHGEAVLAGADCVVPVPLHWRRRLARGFNQSSLLAARLGLPLVRALSRTRHTPSQIDLPADARHANVRDAFCLRRGAAVLDRTVVLVDDVSTTGATLEACAGELLRGGAREVRTLTAARASRRPAPPRRH